MKKGFWVGFLVLLSIFSAPSSAKADCSNVGDACCSVTGAKFCNNGLTCDGSTCQSSAPVQPPQAGGGGGSGGSGSNESDITCDNGLGIQTAIGCLYAGEPKKLVGQLLSYGAGLGVGIAFLMIIFAGLQIATATGDPKRVKAGQELLTSAIAGLMLILFSLVLLNFLGVSILGIPGFVL